VIDSVFRPLRLQVAHVIHIYNEAADITDTLNYFMLALPRICEPRPHVGVQVEVGWIGSEAAIGTQNWTGSRDKLVYIILVAPLKQIYNSEVQRVGIVVASLSGPVPLEAGKVVAVDIYGRIRDLFPPGLAKRVKNLR
jgi:hypothetical protein